MEPYDTFIKLADEIITQAEQQLHPDASLFETTYFRALISDVQIAKGTIKMHRDIMNKTDPELPFKD
jgi:hypothetical protein